MTQWRLALELRIAVDIARKTGRSTDKMRVVELIARNPHNATSRHVAHNLGKARLRWIKETGCADEQMTPASTTRS